MTTAVAKRPAKDPIRQAVDQMAPEFKAALPAHVPVDKFVRVAMTAINSDPNLQQADRRSLFGAVTKLAQDGLLPDGREAALVIFNTKQGGEWVKKVQAMPMIAGLLKMMRQSGEVAWVDAQVVRQGDHFRYRPGLDEQPEFEPDWFGVRGEVVGAYAIARLKSGEIVPPEIMSRAQIEEVRAVSKAKDRGPWADWYDQMALKTVLRRYMKRLPTSTDLLTAFDRDETMATTITAPVTIEPEQQASKLDALEHRIEQGDGDQEAQEDPSPTHTGTIKQAEALIDGATDAAMLDAAQTYLDEKRAELPTDKAEALDARLAEKREGVS